MAFFKKERKEICDKALQDLINDNLLSIYNEILDLLKHQRQQITDKDDIPEDSKSLLIKQHEIFENKIERLYQTISFELFNKNLHVGDAKVILEANKEYVESFNNPLSENVLTQMEKFGSLATNSNLSYQTQKAILDVKNAGIGFGHALAIVTFLFVATVALSVVTGGFSLGFLAMVGLAYSAVLITAGIPLSVDSFLKGPEKRDLVTQRSIGVEEAGDKLESTYKTAMAQ